MKLNKLRQLAQVALFSLMAFGAGSAFAQERGTPGLPSPAGQPNIKAQATGPGLPSPAGQAGIKAQEKGTPGLPSPAGQPGIKAQERGTPGLPSPAGQPGIKAQEAGEQTSDAQVNLREASQASQDVSRFLAQPKLAEALAKAKSDRSMGAEAAQNGNAYLTKQGVQVLGNMTVQIKPSASGGVTSKTKVEVEISCCPAKIKIIIHF